ncbi:MAG: hypothetical protein FVQ82_15570 [Planctomycetes bacterium]|nr:hypothetical protein [Planctomycetota bacterium]
MSFPPIEVWPGTLADQGGVWCAECLEYIEPLAEGGDALQDHHVLQQSYLDDVFGKRSCPGWTVPVHQKCHQKVIDGLGASTRQFLDALHLKTETQQNSTHARLHDLGLYSLCLPAKTRLIEQLVAKGETDAALMALRHAITTASGTRWGDPLVKRCLKVKGASKDPWIVANRAGYAAAFGRLNDSTKLIAQARMLAGGLPPAKQKKLEVVLRRRNSQRVSGLYRADSDTVHAGFRDSEFAYEEAETPYSRKTALVIRASLFYRAGDLNSAHHAVFKLSRDPGEMPWLYEAEALMLYGLCELERNGDPGMVYWCLSRAQYIFCMLGLQSHAPVGTNRLFPGSKRDSMPGHVLMKAPSLTVNSPLSTSDLTEIRRDAIGYPKRPGGSTVWHVIREDLAVRPRT